MMKTKEDFQTLVGKAQFDKSWTDEHARALLKAFEASFDLKTANKKTKKKYKSLKKRLK